MFDTQREVQHEVMLVRRKEEVVFLSLSFRPVASHSVIRNSWLMEDIGPWGWVHCFGVCPVRSLNAESRVGSACWEERSLLMRGCLIDQMSGFSRLLEVDSLGEERRKEKQRIG